MTRPNLIVFAGILILLGLWVNRHQMMNSPRMVADLDLDAPVIMYSTSWCGYCAKARDWFEQHDVQYVEYDVEKSVEGATQYRQLHGRGTPLLVIGDEVIQGYSPMRMELAIQVLRKTGRIDPLNN